MHPNEQLARRELEVLESGDMEALRGLYAHGFVLHYPGKSPLAGDHRSFEAFLGKVGPLMGEGGSVKRTLHDALGNDQHAIQLLTVTANAKGKSHSWHSVVVMHTKGGKIAEAWIHIDNQDALDAFLNSLV